MPFLLWSSGRRTQNTGHAEFPVIDAAGVGHVVVEELDGHAEFPVTDGQGTGTVTPIPVRQPIVIGGPIPRPRTRRIFGSGHAEFPGLEARGTGSIHLPKRTGVGRALLPGMDASGSGRVLPRVSGTGAADVGSPPEAFGSGIVVGPARARTAAAGPRRPVAVADEYDGYIAPTPTSRRVASVSQVDELDELFLMGIL